MAQPPLAPSWAGQKKEEKGISPEDYGPAYARAMLGAAGPAGQAVTGQLGWDTLAYAVNPPLRAMWEMGPAWRKFVEQAQTEIPQAYRGMAGMTQPAPQNPYAHTPEYQEDLAQKRSADISVGMRPDQGPIYTTRPDWREAMRKTRPAEMKRRAASGADATQAALKAGLKGSAAAMRKGKVRKKPAKIKASEVASRADTPALQKSAAAGSNYDGTLLSLIISARKMASMYNLAFVPVYDYKNSKVALVRSDGVDMVYNMKDRRHRDSLRSGLLRAKHDPTEVMQLADRVSVQLKNAIAKDINTEEDVIEALKGGYV